MKWIRIDMWIKYDIIVFNNGNRLDREGNPDKWNCLLNDDQQAMLEDFIREILYRLRFLIRRKFYLYEPQPHVFLTAELRHGWLEMVACYILRKIKLPYFIVECKINKYAGRTEGNGEGFLDVLNAMTDFYLYKKDNKLTHIIHCCMEFQFQTRKKEIAFYQKMLDLYTPRVEKKQKEK